MSFCAIRIARPCGVERISVVIGGCAALDTYIHDEMLDLSSDPAERQRALEENGRLLGVFTQAEANAILEAGEGEQAERLRNAGLVDSVVGLVGLTRTATERPPGIASRRNCSRFALRSTLNEVTPVMLPAGRPKLSTRPSAIGSPPISKTIGIEVVADLAARYIRKSNR